MSEVVIAVLGGTATGVNMAVGGYLKSGDTTKQFDLSNFVQTVVEGTIFGGVAGYLGLDYATAQAYVYNAVGVFTIDYIKKIVVRRVVPALKEVYEKYLKNL
jgi:hypothetical protein